LSATLNAKKVMLSAIFQKEKAPGMESLLSINMENIYFMPFFFL
jgi:hypothetical protein